LIALALCRLVFASYALQFGLERAVPSSGYLAARRVRVHERNAARVLRGMLRLRGVYIKLGQVLSVMVGILPSVYRKQLRSLQDQVPGRPFAEIERAFTRSIGKPPAACLQAIEPQPIAAGSLGQVHVARLLDGREVAIKLLYPGIRTEIALDLRVLRLAMLLFGGIVPRRDLETVHTALVDLLARETDYHHEAACMRRMADHFRDRNDVRVPEVIDELSSSDVLTMTRMHGVRVNDLAGLEAAGIEPQAVGRLLLRCFLEQLFVHRDYQGDPHPGNFLVQRGAEPDQLSLALLDFGAVCEIPQGFVDGLLEALLAFFARDGERLLRALAQMGFVAEDGDRELAQRTVLLYFDRLLRLRSHSPQALIDARPGQLARLLDPELERSELRTLTHAFRMPDGWFYLERALLLMFGLCGSIAPELDLIKVAYPYLMPLLAGRTREGQRESAE
jgi:predicted unusual protein kinase regulating ubiquinone biosynthesis (AarF/ABC1/UbiB family)